MTKMNLSISHQDYELGIFETLIENTNGVAKRTAGPAMDGIGLACQFDVPSTDVSSFKAAATSLGISVIGNDKTAQP